AYRPAAACRDKPGRSRRRRRCRSIRLAPQQRCDRGRVTPVPVRAEKKRGRASEAPARGGGGVVSERGQQARIAPGGPPGRKVQTTHLLGKSLQIAFSDIPAVLGALLEVEQLDEVPHLVLPAGGQRGQLLGDEDLWISGGRLQ